VNKKRQSVLLIDDDPNIAEVVCLNLKLAKLQCNVASSGEEGISSYERLLPDVIILDLGLPDKDGKGVIKHIRRLSSVPIIVLSAREDQQEKIEALDLGADDYVTKPFTPEELLARIRVSLRHSQSMGRQRVVYSKDGLRIDLIQRRAYLGGAVVHLTPTEFDLLSILIRKSGQVVTQLELLRDVWGASTDENDHYLRIYVQRLRQKLGDDPLKPRYIFTEPGIGYRFVEMG